MKGFEPVPTSNPIEHFVPFEMGDFVGEQNVIRGIGPVAEISDEAVFLRVTMNVIEESEEVPVGLNLDAPKSFLKQTAGTVVGFVDSFGIAVEQVAKSLGDLLGGEELRHEAGACGATVSQPERDCPGFDANQQVKMIPHKAISEGVGNRVDVFGIELHEVEVVALFPKNIPAIISTGVNVISVAGDERCWLGHTRVL